MATKQLKKSMVEQTRWVTFFFCLFVVGLPIMSFAGQHVVRIVVSSESAPYSVAADALKQSLDEQKLTVQSVTLETVIKKRLAFITGKSNDIWVAIGSRAAVYLHSRLSDSTPLVYCMVARPESVGLQNSTKNVSGVGVTLPINKQFILIQQALPELQSIGFLYRSSSPKSTHSLSELREQLPVSWQLTAVDIDAVGSMANAIQKLLMKKVGLIWTIADTSVYNRSTIKALLLTSLRHKTPVFGFTGSFVKAGALLGLKTDPKLQGQHAATLVQDIVTQEKQPSLLEVAGVSFAVNMVVAERLGISLPVEVVQKAHVIGVD